LGYLYRFEDYRTDDPIGSVRDVPLTYQDLDRYEHMGELELAFKLWPKTAVLFSTDYGVILHDTGRKADSHYADVLLGLRGEPSAKATTEFKFGFRDQNYEEETEDFNSLVFYGSHTHNFTLRDALRLDFIRTTNDTIFDDNPYYALTFVGGAYKHGFTDRFFVELKGSYQLDEYPVATRLLDGTLKNRSDDILKGGLEFGYELASGIVTGVEYEFTSRESDFPQFDYKNHLLSLSLAYKF